jgi:hypothetical protein
MMSLTSQFAKHGRARDPSSIKRIFEGPRRLALPVMVGAFGLYVVMHSPLRDVIAVLLGLNSRVCYFVCGEALSLSGIAESASAWALIAIAVLAAWVVAERFDGAPYERPLVVGLSGLAFIVGPAAAIGGIGTWVGIGLLRPPLGPLLSLLPAALVVAHALRLGWRPHRPQFTLWKSNCLILLIWSLASGLLSTSTALSLMHPPDGGDALSYHAPLAVFLWRDGNLSAFLDRAPIAWALANPGTAELWYGLLLVAGGERFADLGQLPLALLGGAAVGAFTRRLGLGQGAALLASGAFLLTPMVVMQSTTQANDIAGSGLLMATMAFAAAPAATWTVSRLAFLGLGLGLVATTKLAFLPYVAGILLFMVGATLWHPGQASMRSVAVRTAFVMLFFLLVVAPWWSRNVERYKNPVYPAGIPFIGRGIFVSDFGTIDREFVPGPAAWPLYPLIEPHDDRSGFGTLFAIGVIPGFTLAALRGRRQPLLLYMLVAAFMLPAWWTLTMHEPRFLLALFGLGCAFLPWSLLAVPRCLRHIGRLLLATAAIFSALVTFDQALLPLARQPNTLSEFYDRVWGVDPVVAALPEHEGLLHHTGYGPPRTDYAAYYPLLGRSLRRVVVPVDTEATTDSIVAGMHSAGVRYAYVAALPESWEAVEATYDGSHFELIHMSMIEVGERSGARRYLYQPVTNGSNHSSIRRYLYRLK